MHIKAEQANVALFAQQDAIYLVDQDHDFQIHGHRAIATGRPPGTAAHEVKPALLVEVDDLTDEAELRRMIGMVAEAKGVAAYPVVAQEQDMDRWREEVLTRVG